MIKLPKPELSDCIPTFNYHLIDLSTISDEVLLSGQKALLLNGSLSFLKHSDDVNFIVQESPKIFKFAHTLPNRSEIINFIKAWFEYINDNKKFNKMLRDDFFESLDEQTEVIADSWLYQAEKKGLKKGIEQGILNGEKNKRYFQKFRYSFKIF